MTYDLKAALDNPLLAVSGRPKRYILNPEAKIFPVSCTVLDVHDTCYDLDEDCHYLETIFGSWTYAGIALKTNAGVAINMNRLRPSGSGNEWGMEASGPVSFMTMYSHINDIIRRGNGVYRNGAVTLYMDYDHPDFLKYLATSSEALPDAYRAAYVDEKLFAPENQEVLDAIINAVLDGTLFLAKKRWDRKGQRLFSNVCVTADTWVDTDRGPKQVADLIDTPFVATVDGKLFNSSSPKGGEHLKGFFQTGYKPVYELTLDSGHSLKLTANHKVLTQRGMVEAQHLSSKDKVSLNTATPGWDGRGTFEQGWLIGHLMANGTFSKRQAALDFWDDSLLSRALTILDDAKVSEGADKSRLTSPVLNFLALEYGLQRGAKTASALLEKTSSKFHRGFISGYFDGDCHVNCGQANGSGKQIELGSVDYGNLKMIQRMLTRFGVRSKIYKDMYNGKAKEMPGGVYYCKPLSRLCISGQQDIRTFASVCEFQKEDKKISLDRLLNSYQKSPYFKPFNSRVKSLEYVGIEAVYDCTISNIHKFGANGLVVSNCLEVSIPSRGTCNLSHVNLGMCKTPKDIIKGFTDGMTFLCELFEQTDLKDFYLSRDKDRQVGLGVIGLGNLLDSFGVRYETFVRALEDVLRGEITYEYSPTAYVLAETFYEAYKEAGKIAKKYKMERAFAIAPTATNSFKHFDYNGYSCTPEIMPVITHPETKKTRRESDVNPGELITVEYPPNVEVAYYDVRWSVYYRLAQCFQRLQDLDGLAHAISFNFWNAGCPITKESLQDWYNSNLWTTYYRHTVDQGAQDKTDIGIEVTDEDADFWAPQQIGCACDG